MPCQFVIHLVERNQAKMFRRSPLPQTSRCSRPAPRPVSLTDVRIFRALFVFAVLAVLSLAHVSLKFKTSDLKVQHRQLQERARKLTRQEQEMQQRLQLLAEDRLVRSAARQALQMREIDSRSRLVAQLPGNLVEKYAGSSRAERQGESAVAALPAPRSEHSLAVALTSFVDIGRAEAASVQP